MPVNFTNFITNIFEFEMQIKIVDILLFCMAGQINENLFASLLILSAKSIHGR